MPALEPLPGVARRRRSRRDRRAGRRAAGAARPSCGSRPTRSSSSARRRSASTTRTPSSSPRPASSRARRRPRRRRPPHRVAAARPSGRRSPRARSPACRPSSALARRDGRATSVTAAAYADELPWTAADDERVHRDAAADPLGRRAEAGLRRRDHRRRRARAVHRLPPRDAARDHERRRPRGRLHRQRQHRPQHDDHPRQLRHPRGDPVLPALARAATRASRRRPAPRSSTRPRASSGWPTPRWRCAPSAPARR